MEVTDIRLTLLKNNESSVKAIGSFSLDGIFAIRGVRIFEGNNGKQFVAFPSRQRADGKYEDLAFPLNQKLYHQITSAILNEYHRLEEEKMQSQHMEQAENNECSHESIKKGKGR